MKDTKGFKAWLSVLITVGFLSLIFTLIQMTLDASTKDVVLILVGSLSGMVKDVFGFYFGSSEGSNRKTELLEATKGAPELL